MKIKGGFFIWLSFLFFGCVDSNDNIGMIPEIELRSNDTSEVKEEESNSNDDNFDEKKPRDSRKIDYQNYELGFRMLYPNTWNFLETGEIDSGLVLMMGNFDFDELYHPKENEILVEGLNYDNSDNLDLWNFAISKRPNFRGVLLDYEISNESLRILFDCREIPEDYQGEWMSGYIEDYYFARNDKIYFFSATVLERDTVFLSEFEEMMESFEFQEEENEH
ncbi:MAG: hypothetical protein PHN19_02025 [Patescibacteria group bacterium]|nr:hypothetical protein [Patescibacteria group bacterium]